MNEVVAYAKPSVKSPCCAGPVLMWKDQRIIDYTLGGDYNGSELIEELTLTCAKCDAAFWGPGEFTVDWIALRDKRRAVMAPDELQARTLVKEQPNE